MSCSNQPPTSPSSHGALSTRALLGSRFIARRFISNVSMTFRDHAASSRCCDSWLSSAYQTPQRRAANAWFIRIRDTPGLPTRKPELDGTGASGSAGDGAW